MMRRWGIGFVCLLTVCAVAGADDASTSCSVSGRVLHVVSDEPIGGIRVGLGYLEENGTRGKPKVLPYGTPSERFEATSGVDGRFAIEGISSGRRLLLIRDETMAAVEGELLFDLEPGEHREGITLYVGEGASIGGTVFAEGYYQGVPGVTVEVVAHHMREIPWERSYATVTGPDGGFRIGGIPQGYYDVQSSPVDGFRETSMVFYRELPISPYSFIEGMPLRWATHYAPFEFTVEPGFLVRGRVVDESGAPVAGAGVGAFSGCGFEASVYTGSDGTFLLSNRERLSRPGLMAQKDGGFSDWYPAEENPAPDSTVELVLRAGASLSGQLVDGQRNPVGWPLDVEIELTMAESNCSPYARAEVDKAGYFSMPPLPAGTYKVRLSGAHDYHVLQPPETVVLASGEARSLALVCKETAALLGPVVSGRVVGAGGAPVAGASVGGIFKNSYETMSGPDGYFQYQTLTQAGRGKHTGSPDSTMLVVKADGYFDEHAEVLLAKSQIEVTLQPGVRLSGTVIDVESGATVADAAVGVYTESERSYGSRPRERHDGARVHYGKDGLLAVEGLTGDDVWIRVEKEGHVPVDDRFELEPGRDETNLEFRLKPLREFSGRLVDARGYPIGGAWVWGYKADLLAMPNTRQSSPRGAARSSARVTTDAFGRFNFTENGIEELEVRSPYPRHRVKLADLPAHSGPYTVVVPDGETARGRATVGGEPAVGARISAESNAFPSPYWVMTDSGGYYEIGGLSLGENVLACELEFEDKFAVNRSMNQEIEVIAGQVAEVNFAFVPADGKIEGRVLLPANEADKSVAYVNLLLYPVDGEPLSRSVAANAEGEFVIGNLPPGTATLRASTESKRRAVNMEVNAGETSAVTVDLRDGVSVMGSLVRNGIDGPLVVAFFHRTIDELQADKERRLGLLTGASGGQPVEGDEFRLDDIGPGEGTLVCLRKEESRAGFDGLTIVASMPVTVGRTDITGIELRLPQANALELPVEAEK